ncbi:lysine decarboxylase [Macrococcus hajekii]|uniref:Lysine decarboxylase n=2 Tax=Macrococcus hajekii TaxID=198482 RepID=A0A4R6BHT4_9STAP|nr:lysine decarboxylase [Macrococcus hajekii]
MPGNLKMDAMSRTRGPVRSLFLCLNLIYTEAKGAVDMNPITDQLKSYSDSISLHVPGHHRHTIGSMQLSLDQDMTEITGLDDYHQAETVIADSEISLSRSQAYQSRYLINGTTVGILAIIQAHHKLSDERIAIMRNVHKSVINGLDLTNTEAIILPMEVSEKTNQYIGLNFDELDKCEWDTVDLAILTYPNYFGETFNILEAIQYFHDRNIEVVVDEAHGAHFDITDAFPMSSLRAAADYVVQSYHKTLPALTMGSVIHLKKDSKLISATISYLSVLQTSSPSYLILSSLEQAHQFYLHYNDGEFMLKRQQLIDVLRQAFEVIEVSDPLKLVIKKEGYTGDEIKLLFEDRAVFIELSGYDYILLVLPLWHRDDLYPFDELIRRLKTIEVKTRHNMLDIPFLNLSSGFYTPVTSRVKSVKIDEATGCKLAEALIPYPPGIPYILAGEVLTERLLNVLKTYENVHGIMDGNIKIIVEE